MKTNANDPAPSSGFKKKETMIMNYRNYLILAIIGATLVWAAHMTIPAYNEYKKTKSKLAEVDTLILSQQRENEELRELNYKLQNDPRSIERVAREKFKMSKPGEMIYDFDNSTPANPAK